MRELENAVERSVILNDGEAIEVEAMAIELQTAESMAAPMMESLQSASSSLHTPAPVTPVKKTPSELSLDDYFQHFVLENEDKMTETELALKLGISRKSLWERRQRLGIPRKKSK